MFTDKTPISVYVKLDTDTHKEIAKVKLTEWEVKQLNYALALNHAPIKYITKKEYAKYETLNA